MQHQTVPHAYRYDKEAIMEQHVGECNICWNIYIICACSVVKIGNKRVWTGFDDNFSLVRFSPPYPQSPHKSKQIHVCWICVVEAKFWIYIIRLTMWPVTVWEAYSHHLPRHCNHGFESHFWHWCVLVLVLSYVFMTFQGFTSQSKES